MPNDVVGLDRRGPKRLGPADQAKHDHLAGHGLPEEQNVDSPRGSPGFGPLFTTAALTPDGRRRPRARLLTEIGSAILNLPESDQAYIGCA